MTDLELTGLLRRLDIRGAVAEQPCRRNRLREYDPNGDEDSPSPGSERHCNFDPAAFGVLIAAAERDAAFGQVLAHRDFFLEATPPNAGQHPRFYPGAVAAR